MAITFKKDQLGVTARNSDHLSPVAEKFLEGASQTFLAGSLVKFTGGYILVAAAVNTAPAAGSLFGIALEDAHNGTAGANYITVVRFEPTHEIYANLLGAAAADLTLAITHLGADVDLLWATNYLGTGISGWFATAGGGATAEVVSFRGDQVPSPAGRLPTNEAQVGDINARVRVRIKPAVLSVA